MMNDILRGSTKRNNRNTDLKSGTLDEMTPVRHVRSDWKRQELSETVINEEVLTSDPDEIFKTASGSIRSEQSETENMFDCSGGLGERSIQRGTKKELSPDTETIGRACSGLVKVENVFGCINWRRNNLAIKTEELWVDASAGSHPDSRAANVEQKDNVNDCRDRVGGGTVLIKQEDLGVARRSHQVNRSTDMGSVNIILYDKLSCDIVNARKKKTSQNDHSLDQSNDMHDVVGNVECLSQDSELNTDCVMLPRTDLVKEKVGISCVAAESSVICQSVLLKNSRVQPNVRATSPRQGAHEEASVENQRTVGGSGASGELVQDCGQGKPSQDAGSSNSSGTHVSEEASAEEDQFTVSGSSALGELVQEGDQGRPSQDAVHNPGGDRPYQCHDCGLLLARMKLLRAHLLDHVRVKRYRCHDCGAWFWKLDKLRVHLRRHAGDRPHQCDQCGQAFLFQHILHQHKQVHLANKPVHTCDICNASFTHRRSLLRHKRDHNGKNVHKCYFCHAEFVSRSALCEHKTLHLGEKPHRCEECGNRFSTRAKLAEHKRKHTGVTYRCDVCSATLVSSKSFRRHKKTHQEDRPFKCDQCDKTFIEKRDLLSHKKVHKDKLFPCDKCEKKFRSIGQLSTHKDKHSGNKTYKCDTCGIEFASKQKQQQHVRSHNVEKFHRCEICDKSFICNSHLVRHTLIHTAVKSCVCELCGMKFYTPTALKRHQGTHSKPYKCEVCGAGFSCRDKLSRHEQVHSLDKPLHKCDSCGAHFANMLHLRMHNRMHAGGRLYTCDMCNISCAYRRRLVSHIKRHLLSA